MYHPAEGSRTCNESQEEEGEPTHSETSSVRSDVISSIETLSLFGSWDRLAKLKHTWTWFGSWDRLAKLTFGLAFEAHRLLYHAAQGSRTCNESGQEEGELTHSETLCLRPEVNTDSLVGSWTGKTHTQWLICQAHRLLHHSVEGSKTC